MDEAINGTPPGSSQAAWPDGEEQVRLLLNSTAEAVYGIDLDGRCTFCNPACLRMLGYGKIDDLLSGKMHELIHHTRPDGTAYPATECQIHRSIRQGRGVHRESEVLWRADGSSFPAEYWSYPIRRGQEVLGAVVSFFDITERKKAEEALRAAHRELENRVAERTSALTAANEFLRALLENIQDGIVACDAEGVLTLFNSATRKFHGLPEAGPEPSLPAKQWPEHYYLRGADGQTPMKAEEVPLYRALQGELVRDAQLVIAPPNAPPRTLLASGQAFYDGEGRKLGAVVSMYDITERQRAEEALRRAHEELEQRVKERTAELAHANAALQDAHRRKDEFLAALAHELRNPLAPIRSGLDLLAIDGTGNGEIAQLMKGQLEHLVRLVDDLLDVARIMRGKVQLRRETVELSVAIDRAVEMARPLIESRRQHLLVSQPPEAIWLSADPVRLTQVLSNLLNNAAKYTEPGGRIELVGYRRDAQAIVEVRDSGIGIDPNFLPHVFELFAQADQSLDRAQGGLGVGLALVHRLVEMHDGTVAAHSEGRGRGSHFIIHLPVLVSNTASPPTPALSTPEPIASRRILVVDDSVAAGKILSLLLAKLGDHLATVVHDGPTALAAAEEHRPELVFLDIGLPELDGYEVAKRLRAMPQFQETLLVALTGYGQAEDRRKSREAGFDEHLVKPPSVEDLRRILAHPKLQ